MKIETSEDLFSGMSDGEAPGVMEWTRLPATSLGLLKALASPGMGITSGTLCDMLAGQPAVCARMIQRAKSPGCNPAGLPVTSLASAIDVTGLEPSRRLALCLLAQRAAEERLGAPERVLAETRVMASAHLAQELVVRQGSFDPQLGLACAMLRNHGRWLISQLLVETEGREAAIRGQLDDDSPFLDAFGISPAELAGMLWRSAQLPPRLQAALDDLPGYLITTSEFSHEDGLLLWTGLSLALCDLLLEPGGATGGPLESRVEEVLEEAAATHSLSGSEVIRMFRRVASRLAGFQDTHPGLPFDDLLMKRLSAP